MNELRSAVNRVVHDHIDSSLTVTESGRIVDEIVKMIEEPLKFLSNQPAGFVGKCDVESEIRSASQYADNHHSVKTEPQLWMVKFMEGIARRWPTSKAPKIPGLKPPFTVGTSMTTTVFDSKDTIVVRFPPGADLMAREYAQFLNLNNSK